MKKSVVVLTAILFLGVLAADVALQQPMAAYAAAQSSGTQAEGATNNAKDGQGGKVNDGHSEHH
ncbi:MAG: hypothetical protein RIN56_18810 [Sporomusaceae bacterium]|nr:hypothetical protein [Sporomusaceae bacterium]